MANHWPEKPRGNGARRITGGKYGRRRRKRRKKKINGYLISNECVFHNRVWKMKKRRKMRTRIEKRKIVNNEGSVVS